MNAATVLTALAPLTAYAPQIVLLVGMFCVLALGMARPMQAWSIRFITLFSIGAALLSTTLLVVDNADRPGVAGPEVWIEPPVLTGVGSGSEIAPVPPDEGHWEPGPRIAAHGPLVAVDDKSIGWQVIAYLACLPLAFCLRGRDDAFAALFLGSALGVGLLSISATLPMLFIALELMSLPAYLMVARSRPGHGALEGAIKYFFAGGLAGALYLMGMALYYAGQRTLGGSGDLAPLGQAGAGLMCAAALFKLGAVPFHWWLPDAYEAAAPEVSGYLSTAMKAAAVLFLMRLCDLFPAAQVLRVLPAVGAITALVGAALALRQNNLQRLFAYSSVSHAGILILGVGAWARGGRDAAGTVALVFYLAAYALMSNGAFLAIKASGCSTRAQLKGLGRRAPGLAGAFAVLALALAGIPPTGGFFAKFLVFWRALDVGLVAPTIACGLASLLSLGYYLAIVRDLYFDEPEDGAPAPQAGVTAMVIACAAGALALGAAPWFLVGVSLGGGFGR